MISHKIKKFFGIIKYFLIFLLERKRIKFESIPSIYCSTNFYIDKNSTIIIGKNFSSRNNVQFYCMNSSEIKIGSNCFFNDNCEISSRKKIEIGNNCIFGNNVSIYDNDHDYKNNLKEFKESSIKIEDNCWIGCNVVILKGIKIGKNSVIGAGTIVNKDIPANSLVYNENKLIIKKIKKGEE